MSLIRGNARQLVTKLLNPSRAIPEVMASNNIPLFKSSSLATLSYPPAKPRQIHYAPTSLAKQEQKYDEEKKNGQGNKQNREQHKNANGNSRTIHLDPGAADIGGVDGDIDSVIDEFLSQSDKMFSETLSTLKKTPDNALEFVKNFDAEELLLKTLAIILPRQNTILTEEQRFLRKEIAREAHKNFEKNPDSTYIYLVDLINKHLLENNYPVPPEIGKQILENIKQAGASERSGASLHFNETLIFGKNAINKAVKEGTIDVPSVLGSILNVVGGMITGGADHGARKRGLIMHTGLSAADEKKLEALGRKLINKAEDLQHVQIFGMNAIKALEANLCFKNALNQDLKNTTLKPR